MRRQELLPVLSQLDSFRRFQIKDLPRCEGRIAMRACRLLILKDNIPRKAESSVEAQGLGSRPSTAKEAHRAVLASA